MSIENGGPAFPVPMFARLADGQPLSAAEFGLGGITVRDYFAAMALQARLSNPALTVGVPKLRSPAKRAKRAAEFAAMNAARAYEYADAMLAERRKAVGP